MFDTKGAKKEFVVPFGFIRYVVLTFFGGEGEEE